MTVKKLTRWLMGLIIILGIAAGCSSQNNEVNVTQADNDTQIELAQDQTLVLTLDSNVTTGYEWDIVEFDDQIIQPVGASEYLAPDTDAVGAGGQEIYKFECAGTGQSPLELIYHQPFDETTAPAETFTLTVTCR